MGPESATRTFTISVCDRLGFRGLFRGTHGVHVSIMPQSARTGCRLRHTLLVMNSAPHVHFRSATLVDNFRSGTLPPGVRPQAGNPPLAAPLFISSPFRSLERARYLSGQYFPSLVVFGTQR